MKLNKKLYTTGLILFFILLFAFAYRKLWAGGMFAYNDCLPFPGTAQEAFRAFLSAWDNRSPGVNLPLRHTLFVTLLKGVLVFICGGNSILAQRIFLFLPMPLSFLAMYIFLSRFINSKFAKYIAAFLYSITPMAIGELQGGWIQNIYVQAIFPALIICLIKMAQPNKRILNLFLFSLLFAISFLLSDHILLFIAPVILFWLFFDFENKIFNCKRHGIKIKILFLLLAAVITFLLTSYHIGFFLKSALPFLGGSNILRPDVLNVLTNDVLYCYGNSTMKVILSLGKPLAQSLSKQIINFTPFILCLFSLFFIRNSKKSKHIIISSLGAFFVILFIWLTHKKETIWLFQHCPILFRFRNHARPLLLLSFFYAPLIALGLDGVEKNLSNYFRFRKNKTKIGIIVLSVFYLCIIAGVATYNNTFWAGDFQLLKIHKNIVIPDSYYEATDWLNKKHTQEGFFRTLWLPWELNEEEVHLAWLDPYTLSVPIGYGQYAQSPLVGYIEFIFRSLANGQTEYLGDLLALANVKYIVVNLASQQKGPARAAIGYFTPYLFGAPQNFIHLLNKEKDFELVVDRKDYWIYRNKKFIPHLTPYSKVSFVSPRSKSNPLFLLSYLLTDGMLHPQEELLLFGNTLPPDQEDRIVNYLGEEKERVIVSPKYSFLDFLDDDFDRGTLDEKNWLPTTEPLKFIHSTEVILPLKQGEVEFLMSRGEFRYPVVFETRAKLSPESLHADIRFEYDGSDGAMFALKSDSNLSVSTYNNSWQTTETKLGVHDFTKYYVYKLIWEEGRVRFYVDGDLKATHTTNIPVKWARVRFGATSGQTFTVDYVKVERYKEEPTTTIFKGRMASPLNFKASKINETKYKIEIENQEPVFIFLGEAHHPSWRAYSNNKELEHFPAFYWANGFYLDKKGRNTVRIIYSEQKVKNITLIISGISWILLVTGISILHKKSGKER